MVVQWNADAYDALPLPHERWGAGVVMAADPRPGEVVVDAGCGTGRDAARILQVAGPDVSLVLLDGDERMVAAARDRFSGMDVQVPVHHVDLTTPWPITPGSVDVIISVAALHWVADLTAVCAHAALAAAPGGRFVFECGGFGNLEQLAAAAVPLGLRMPTCFYRTPDQATRALADASWSVESARLVPDPWIPATRSEYVRFLKSVIFHAESETLLDELVDANPDLVIDYVRLQVSARRR